MDRRQSAVLSCSWAVRPPDWPCGLPAGLLGAQRAGGSGSLTRMCCLVCRFRSAAFSPARSFGTSLVLLFFSPSSFSFSPPLLFCSFFRLPFYFSFPKSQRDSQWGVVGYDLRAGCDLRRGSQRCVGRGARGAVPGMDWAWSGRAVQYREWRRRGVLVGQADGWAGRSPR